jgi:hypothetical protein
LQARTVLCCLCFWLGCVAIPSTLYAQSASDNPSVTGQLNDAKTTAAKIKKDAVQMQSFAFKSSLNWKTHQDVLDKIKVNVQEQGPPDCSALSRVSKGECSNRQRSLAMRSMRRSITPKTK